MAVWIDENGTLVRPAEQAGIERSPSRDLEIPDGLPDRLKRMMTEVKQIPDDSEIYRAALLDWIRNGNASPYAMSPDEVVAASRPKSIEQSTAGACFAMGEYLHRTVGHDAAVPYWRRAHALDPDNWTYKRQAWTLVTTPEGAAENDLMQGPNDVYEGNWLDDVLAAGGGTNYYVRAKLERPK